MSRKGQNDFEELELYLKKAQEELLSSFSADEDTVTEGETFGSLEGQTAIVDKDRDSFSDILDLYDNVEFYKENKKKFNELKKSTDEEEIKRDFIDDKNNNTINGNEKVENTKEVRQIKSSDGYGQDGFSRKDKSNFMNEKTSKKGESITLRESNKQQVADLESNLIEPLTCKDVKNRSQGSQVVKKTGNQNHMDDLSDCNKSPNVSYTRSAISKNLSTRPTDRKSTSKLCQEASAHLELAGNDHVSGSLIEVTQENSSSFIVADMQIDGKQPSYLTGDNSQLDNGESDIEIEGGTLMSLRPRDVSILESDGYFGNKLEDLKDRNSGNYGPDGITEKNGDNVISLCENGMLANAKTNCKIGDNGEDSVINYNYTDSKKAIKDDLEEFLEEINESIDELISEGRNEMSDSCASVSSKSGISDSGSRSDIADSAVCSASKSIMSDSGVSFISRSDISESCISYTSTDSGFNNSQISQSSSDQIRDGLERNESKGSESSVMKGIVNEVKDNEEKLKNKKDQMKHRGKKMKDEVNKVKGRESEGKDKAVEKVIENGDEVVETDEGFYWVTCSIEEGGDTSETNEMKQLGRKEMDEPGVDMNSRNRDGDNPINLLTEDASENTDRCKLGKADAELCGEIKTTDQRKTVTNENKEKKAEVLVMDNRNDQTCVTSKNKKIDIKSLLKLPGGSRDLLTDTISSGFGHKTDQDTVAKDDCILEKQDEIYNAKLRRKYSCPPTMFRVFKVVSVDIPKIDTVGKSGSHDNIKRLSLKSHEKRHSKHSKQENEGEEPKRHSLEALLSKQKEERENKKQLKEKIDKNGFKTRIEPPAMFRDKQEEDVNNGPILKPPPDFDTNGQAAVMDTQHLPPPVWDPGVTSGPSCLHSGEANLDKKLKHPSTPPPPSVDRTEKLISTTLNQHKHRKHSADANSGLVLLKPPDCVRRKSADSGIKSEYVDLDSFQNSSSQTSSSIKDNKIRRTGAREFETEDCRYNISPDLEPDSSKLPNIISGNVKSANSSEYQEILPRNELGHDASNAELSKMLDLIESYQTNDKSDSEKNTQKHVLPNKENLCHTQELSYTESNKSQCLDRRKAEKIEKNINDSLSDNEDDPSAIYATVDKSRPRKPSPEKVVPENVSEDPPPIPPKPKHLLEAFSNKNSMTRIESAQSSDLQVMFNSLSPVLLRRNNSNRSHRKHGSSTETSPDSTPDVSPRGVQSHKNNLHKNQGHSGQNGPVESLFMDPEMARTWHGATSTDWSQYYGPQMKAMMKELNKLNNVESHDSVNKSAESLDESKSKTLPSKSLLDEMHKKFCADQYMNEKDIEMTRALVLFRLKSQHPPSKARRSQSFNIRMGTGASYSRLGLNASGSSASSESSPRIPRSSERLRIKTRPDVQYSPKPMQVRGVTPEPLKIEDCSNQAQNSQKEEAEIEAIEACRWLRETGFPQYAQLYEDGQFPLDIESVEKDHDFLDKEDIQSLFRRLNTLNKCAIMKIGTPTKKESEESDEEDLCALSDKWKYQRSSRRWSRKDLDCPVIENRNGQPVLKSASSHDSLLADQNSSSETGDSPVLDSKMLHTSEDMVFKTSTPTYDANGNTTTGPSPRVIRRAASDRIKGAKSFLKRMESLKGKRTRKNKTITEISGPVVTDNADMQAKIKHLNCKDINVPVDANSNIPEASEVLVNGDSKGNVAITSPELITSPRNEALTVVTPPRKSDDSSALSTTNSSALKSDTGNTSTEKSSDLSHISANGALGLDLSVRSRHSNCSDGTNSSEDTLFIPVEYRPGKFPTLLDDSLFSSDSNVRTRSYSYADDNDAHNKTKHTRRGSHDPRKQMNRISIYDNVPIEEDLATAQEELDIILSELFQNINGLNKAINGENAELLEPPVSDSFLDDSSVSIDSQSPENEANLDSPGEITQHDENELISGTLSSPDISDHETQTEDMSHDDSAEHIVVRERRDSGVGSSLTRTNSERRKYRIRWHSFQKSHRPTSESRNLQLCNLSAGQILVLRKLSLLKLTALIEKYAPNRSGWSLTVPRFMKRNKVPDYKDRNVFGVPFSVMIQRSGQALPQCILHAMRFLRRTAEDALGIFRKSGVRSRIQKLRNDIEADPEAVDFEDLQAYDVADLVKQYFRELPECLLTNKLSDIFISIFIYVPTELRLEALQAAVVLMADENRDVLQSLLLFLSDIAKQASKHQMTASNLAVCFAPSLFNMGGARSINQTPSPRRNRKNPGIPDARELMEQKAAHECLTVMINECKKLFTISAVTLSKCRVLHEDPVTLEELNKQSEDGSQGYSAHIESCIQGLLKESREKFRGWVSVSAHTDVDVSYKKVGDGHPLRLWKCTVDVEAPPNEVLNRVLNERQKWDEDLLQWNTVEKLDQQTEVFQYVRNSMAPHPTRDYSVLRSWRTDLPKGACVLISTSIEHKDSDLLVGIRGVELASRYLIEPCGTGKSRLTHISRVDLRGHSPEWYKKVYGHICANFMDRIRASFRCNSEGPETKV